MLWFIADIIYCLCMLWAAIECLLLGFKKKLFLLLSAYSIIFLMTELYTMSLPKGTYNHYIYATRNVFASAFLLLYFNTLVKNIMARALSIIFQLVICFIYIKNKMWLPPTIIPTSYIPVYYFAISFIIALLCIQLVKQKRTTSIEFKQGFGFFFLYAISVINLSMVYSSALIGANKTYLFWTSEITEILLFLFIGIIAKKIYSTANAY